VLSNTEKQMGRGKPRLYQMNSGFVHIEIRDHDSFMEACDLLHDAGFDLSALEVDTNIGSWKASFEREFFEEPSLMRSESRLIVFTKRTFPLISSQLTLQDVASYEIKDQSGIGRYSFNVCHFNGSAYELWFCENMRMIVRFKDKPHGELRDLNLLAKEGSFFALRNPFTKKTV
jgi:hypothetical protein